jgi:ABC-type phosphate transport system substrate-binding protein
MTGLKARSLASAVAVSAISAVAFVAPGTASAACTGANIKGNGSSLQASAQQKIWSPAFNAKCAGPPATEQVEYISTSSGKGLSSWGVGKTTNFQGFGPTNAFVGTDQPPNGPQETEILAEAELTGSKLLSIPVLQAAVALPIRLPEGCTATSGKGKAELNRLVLSDAQLQGIFAGTIKTWAQLVEKGVAFNEDKLVGTSCNSSAPIVRVVRKEGSGTTAITKKFLFEINKGAVDGTETWNELAEKNENLNWPDEGENLVRAEKGSGIATTVATTPGSIGYANLNEVRANAAFTPAGGGGENSDIFWPELQNSGKKFQDPATNKEANEAANANCNAEDYVSLNGKGTKGKFPPESTEDLWNEVTASTKQKTTYALCGFTYDLSLTDFADFSGTSEAEVTTLSDYFNFVLGEGQTLLNNHDFLGLPTAKSAKGNVLEIARAGARKIA